MCFEGRKEVLLLDYLRLRWADPIVTYPLKPWALGDNPRGTIQWNSDVARS
jgi:hypothetical protein